GAAMVNTIGLADATAALEEYFGPRLEAAHDEGLRLMADALHERFGITTRKARELLQSLETARSIRWHSYGEQPSGGVDGGALGGWEQPAPVPLEGGYWQL